MLARLREYALHETPTGDVPALDSFLDLLERRYRGLGGSTARVGHPTGAHLVAQFPGTRAGKPVLCLAHHDTVWPAGSLPWRASGDTVFGPGVYDMKGGLVVLEAALERCPSRRPVTVLVVADEEIGSPTARSLIEEHAAGAVAALGFEPPHPDGAVKTARRGSTRLRLAVTGRESHAALSPEEGVSAIDELVDQLLTVRRITSSVLCNVGTIGGGGRTNVVPASAWCEIGLRFTDTGSERTVLAALAALRPHRPGAEVTVTVLTSRPVWSRADPGLLRTVREAAAAVGQSIEGRPAAGGADTNVTGALGLPTIDGLGPLGRGAHAPDEQIRVPSLAARADLVAALLGRV